MIYLQKNLKVPKKKIEMFCRKWQIVELSLFGSVLREDFRSDSDIDILVAFSPEAKWGLLDHEAMREELVDIFGRDVDLVSKKAIERSQNQIRKKAILGSAKLFYAA